MQMYTESGSENEGENIQGVCLQPLDCLNHATADFIAGITGWLGSKVIPHAVNHKGAANYIIEVNPSGIKTHPCITIIAKQWRKVACVFRMRNIIRIVVIAGVRECLHPHRRTNIPECLYVIIHLYIAGNRHVIRSHHVIWSL